MPGVFCFYLFPRPYCLWITAARIHNPPAQMVLPQLVGEYDIANFQIKNLGYARALLFCLFPRLFVLWIISFRIRGHPVLSEVKPNSTVGTSATGGRVCIATLPKTLGKAGFLFYLLSRPSVLWITLSRIHIPPAHDVVKSSSADGTAATVASVWLSHLSKENLGQAVFCFIYCQDHPFYESLRLELAFH